MESIVNIITIFFFAKQGRLYHWRFQADFRNLLKGFACGRSQRYGKEIPIAFCNATWRTFILKKLSRIAWKKLKTSAAFLISDLFRPTTSCLPVGRQSLKGCYRGMLDIPLRTQGKCDVPLKKTVLLIIPLSSKNFFKGRKGQKVMKSWFFFGGGGTYSPANSQCTVVQDFWPLVFFFLHKSTPYGTADSYPNFFKNRFGFAKIIEKRACIKGVEENTE